MLSAEQDMARRRFASSGKLFSSFRAGAKEAADSLVGGSHGASHRLPRSQTDTTAMEHGTSASVRGSVRKQFGGADSSSDSSDLSGDELVQNVTEHTLWL